MSEFRTQRRPTIGSVTGSAALLVALITMVMQLSSGAEAAPQAQHKITAKQLAPGAVTAKAIARGAVTAGKIRKSAVIASKLAKESVTVIAMAPSSVTAAAIAPGSVGSHALVPESIHATPIADLDKVASNPEWTASNTEVTMCGSGEALLGTGFIFTEPGNKEVGFLRAAPSISPSGDGVSGEISSNSGGTAKAQIMAVCLGY